jgi:hypothetical protein
VTDQQFQLLLRYPQDDCHPGRDGWRAARACLDVSLADLSHPLCGYLDWVSGNPGGVSSQGRGLASLSGSFMRQSPRLGRRMPFWEQPAPARADWEES